MKIIATVHNGFHEKFGVPRQSGLVEECVSTIVFRKEYRVKEALRGIEGFSHIWLIWEFSEAVRDNWSPTVRPPRLGGNERLGVFATRSPFRPNALGLSAVRLLSVDYDTPCGPVLTVAGADMMDGTPVYDIKPYLPYADCIPCATGGFTDTVKKRKVSVVFPREFAVRIPENELRELTELLALDPRPSYQDDAFRVYGFSYGAWNIRFRVENGVLTVCDTKKL